MNEQSINGNNNQKENFIMNMNNNKSSKRYRLYYSETEHPEGFVSKNALTSPQSLTLAGADRSRIDKKTQAAEPSDLAVEEMRSWNEQKID